MSENLPWTSDVLRRFSMPVYFHNTMSREREEFKPIVPGEARMYTCGPTVYNFAHIGNFRAYLFEDFLRRTLKYCGYKVVQVMNLTDVDDKTIRDSRAAGIPLNEYTAKFKKAFFEDIEKLRIEKAEFYPEATAHIPEMIEMISVLLDKGFAYRAEDGSIYYSVAKFAEYGKLARIDMENQRAGARVKTDEYAKDSVSDFAIWKAWDENDGDVAWDSPWGRGRPGWHIECSAMSMKYLGRTFDIHTGGIDNMFPHHEDEIAQSEAANGCRFVNYWLHCEHLVVDGQKMSKSLGNFYTLRDIFQKGYTGREVRFALLCSHYRNKLNFSFDALEKSRTALRRMDAFFKRIKIAAASKAQGESPDDLLKKAEEGFAKGISDDLNISEALAEIHGLENELNKLMESGRLGSKCAQDALNLFKRFDGVLAIFDEISASDDVPAEIKSLADQRQAARKARDFRKADEIRDRLKTLGWILEDTPSGPRILKG